jgi:hypothetical protein
VFRYRCLNPDCRTLIYKIDDQGPVSSCPHCSARAAQIAGEAPAKVGRIGLPAMGPFTRPWS